MTQQEAIEFLSKNPIELSHKQKCLIARREVEDRRTRDWSQRLDFLFEQFQLVGAMTDDDCQKEFWKLFNVEDMESGEGVLARHEALRLQERADIQARSLLDLLGE